MDNVNLADAAHTINFGVHLTLDGYDGSAEKLNNYDVVYRCLDELPEKIGMKKMIAPVVKQAVPVSEKDSGGFSGFVMITTSHISCHTFPNRRFVSIDVYTCDDHLDKDFLLQYFKDAFALKDLEVNYLKRGTRFPASDL